MAKYIYTHGKRKGKVYQEFYYTLNGEQIVNKKTFYCPVNTKWLSRVEFREYILQVIRDYYPNYLVINELPEELETHIIYFVKHVNKDESFYYDVYVYDEEQQKQIKFNYVKPEDLNEINEILNNLTTKSLKNIYNKTLQGNRNIITDANGYLTTDSIPHLYMHWIHFDKGGTGEVNVVVYDTSPYNFTANTLGTFLYHLGCTTSFKMFPATGCNPAGFCVQGIYGYYESSGMIIRSGFVSVAINGTRQYTNDFSDYNGGKIEKVIQLF